MSRPAAAVAFAFALAGTLALAGPARADHETTTRISVSREIVDGTRAKEGLAGRVVLAAPGTWRRTSHDTAPTARFTTAESDGCAAIVKFSVRAVASHESARFQARHVTRSPAIALAQGDRPGGAWRLARIEPAGPQLYGVAVVRLAPGRWLDVRVYAWFTGCTEDGIRSGHVARDIGTMLQDARVQARVVRRR